MKSIELARLIAVYSYNNNVKAINGEGGLAQAIGLPPLAIINALYAGEKNDIFSVKRNKGGFEKVTVSDEQFDDIAKGASNFGEQFATLVDSFKELIFNVNSRENDLNRDQLYLWSGGEGLSPAVFDTALYVLMADGEFVSYTIGNPKDKKTIYTFLTQADNKDKRWGLKQLGK